MSIIHDFRAYFERLDKDFDPRKSKKKKKKTEKKKFEITQIRNKIE